MINWDPRTFAVGFPWEKPVPIGCSTYRTLERLVQLHSFCVGKAWPGFQVKGYVVLDIVLTINIAGSLLRFPGRNPPMTSNQDLRLSLGALS
jgi:hypothetical protein